MKKIISLLLSATMLSATVASAKYETKSEFLTDLGVPAEMQSTISTEFPFTVDADIMVREAEDDDYVDGPIVVKKTAGQTLPKFDFKASFDMKPVWQTMYAFINRGAKAIGGDDADLVAQAKEDLKNVPVTGSFTIKVICPDGLDIPEDFIEATDMEGFTDNVKQAFEEVSRTFDSDTNTFTLEVKLKDNTNGGILMGYYDPDVASKSADFEFACEDLDPSDFGTYTVYGEVEGKIVIGDGSDDTLATVTYNAIQEGTDSDDELEATVEIEKKSQTTVGGNPGGGIVPPVTNTDVKVEFDINGNRNIINPLTGKGSVNVNYDLIKPADIEGMTFDGWYIDPQFTSKLTGSQNVVGNLVVYGRYVITSAPGVFDAAHKAYIKGYPDGTVQPMGLITREEITTALYRLLKDSVVAKITTNENNFADVDADRWSNTSISSMSNGGYIKGYEDGTFKPANDITRAEFATLVLRFFDNTDAFAAVNNFSDVSGHWAEANIVKADAIGLFNGYEDGTFKPDAYITRAEAMAVINRITVRRANNNSFTGNFINWPDISTSDWYYADVIEATNTHDFTRIDEVMTEKWTDVSYTELIVG